MEILRKHQLLTLTTTIIVMLGIAGLNSWFLWSKLHQIQQPNDLTIQQANVQLDMIMLHKAVNVLTGEQ